MNGGESAMLSVLPLAGEGARRADEGGDWQRDWSLHAPPLPGAARRSLPPAGAVSRVAGVIA